MFSKFKVQELKLPDNILYVGSGNVPSWLTDADNQPIETDEYGNPMIPTDIEGNPLYEVFEHFAKVYVNKGSHTLLSLWQAGITPYNKGTEELLCYPHLFFSKTQTTASIKIGDSYPEYMYSIQDIPEENVCLLTNNEIRLDGLYPECKIDVSLDISKGNHHFTSVQSFSTDSINPKVGVCDVTASSLSLIKSYDKGDAKVVDSVLKFMGKDVNEENNTVIGLNPNEKYTASYSLIVQYGKDGLERTYTGINSFSTLDLLFEIQPVKVVSERDVVISANTNLSDSEKNVGFEWRKVGEDESLFESNKGQAYLYEGEMEGYIRNLNPNFLWKFRPYYQSNAGNYYYGDWKGIDLSDDQSYFEPTVHTYANIDVQDDEA